MTESTVRHGRATSETKRRVRIAVIAIGSVLLLLAASVGLFLFSLSQQFNSVEKITEVFPEETLRPPVVVSEEPVAQNILLLGSDSRGSIGTSINDIKGTRTDTMMIVHVSADRQSIQVMSLMRDSWVEIPGYGTAKLNAAMAYGGVPLAVQTIEGIIDSRIDHVAMVDFEGFKGITNALGGVMIDNPRAFSVSKYSYEAGLITLNGDQALPFVRERYAFEDGDYTRVANQQVFIKAVMAKVLTMDTLTNPVKINGLVGAVVPYMAVDAGLNSNYAVSLGFEMRDIRVSDVKFFTMPTLGTGMEGNQSVVKVDWAEVPKIQAAFKDDTLDSYTPPTRP